MVIFPHLFAACAVLMTLIAPAPGASAIAIAPPQAPATVTLNYFTLSKSEAAKGEQVVARWSFSGRAQSVVLNAAIPDGPLLLDYWVGPAANSAELTFTVPYSLYTISPLMVGLNVNGQLIRWTPLLITCDNSWFFIPRARSCPSMPIRSSWAAYQEFEHGRMVWIQSRGFVYVLYDSDVASSLAGHWETFEDHFRDGDPETDPAIVAPAGMQQPIRGFGLVWRTQTRVRDVLGWALSHERGYTACLGAGFGGRRSSTAYLNDADNRIMELRSDYMPSTWGMYAPGPEQKVVFTGCE